MDSLTRKRKLDAPNDDQPPTDLLLVVPTGPKRPRLALSTPSSPRRRQRSPSPAPRRRQQSPPPRRRQPQPPAPAYSLHRRLSVSNSILTTVASPVSPVSPHHSQPPLLPPITRHTLRELDLDAILRNPQLRHDLLFDPGLQFRPTCGRRKFLNAERYWAAVAHELHHIPTSDSKPIPRPPTPPPWSPRCFSSTSSRITPMLHELLAVLSTVIVPPPLGSAPPPPPSPDARALLDHLDPDLIAQELRRGLFDPAGIFALIGATLKRHCAPMRDSLVDAMIRCAEGSQEDEDDTPSFRSLYAIRMCFEILELMKLDIANHQLQHLRPFLAASTPDFELRTFIDQCRRTNSSPTITRSWLQRFYPGPSPPSPSFTSRHTRVHRTLIQALTHLIFNPVHPHQRPETLYLDAARVTLLEKDAADLTALYMLLMLWRQLVCAKPQKGAVVIEDWEVDRVKREIWEVGPRRIGSCFLQAESEESRARWDSAMESVILQIALRAEERAPMPTTTTAATTSTTSTTARKPPSSENLALMRGWITSHLRRDSALAGRMRGLLMEEVIKVTCGDGGSERGDVSSVECTSGASAGLEPLAPEIAHLSQRVGKVVGVHVGVYWSLYEAEGFLR